MFRRSTSRIQVVDIKRLTSGLVLIEGVCAMSLAIWKEGWGGAEKSDVHTIRSLLGMFGVRLETQVE